MLDPFGNHAGGPLEIWGGGGLVLGPCNEDPLIIHLRSSAGGPCHGSPRAINLEAAASQGHRPSTKARALNPCRCWPKDASLVSIELSHARGNKARASKPLKLKNADRLQTTKTTDNRPGTKTELLKVL